MIASAVPPAVRNERAMLVEFRYAEASTVYSVPVFFGCTNQRTPPQLIHYSHTRLLEPLRQTARFVLEAQELGDARERYINESESV